MGDGVANDNAGGCGRRCAAVADGIAGAVAGVGGNQEGIAGELIGVGSRRGRRDGRVNALRGQVDGANGGDGPVSEVDEVSSAVPSAVFLSRSKAIFTTGAGHSPPQWLRYSLPLSNCERGVEY